VAVAFFIYEIASIWDSASSARGKRVFLSDRILLPYHTQVIRPALGVNNQLATARAEYKLVCPRFCFLLRPGHNRSALVAYYVPFVGTRRLSNVLICHSFPRVVR
jgi:hypothetical protein